MNKLKSKLKLVIMITCLMALGGCMSLGQLSYKQAQVLKKEGFSLTEDGWTLNFPEESLFGFDQINVHENQKQTLIRLSQQLQHYNLLTVRMLGHTDNIGNAQYNQQLSYSRAMHVAQIFIDSGFKKENIEVLGRGSKQPLVSNNSAQNRSLNRRVTLIIIP